MTTNFGRFRDLENRQLTEDEMIAFMSRINVMDMLNKLQVRVSRDDGDFIMGYCPDHHLRRGSAPSHPKWYMNKLTGKTYCHTECHNSNILEIAANLWDIESQRDVASILLDGKEMPSKFEIIISNLNKVPERKVNYELEEELQNIQKLLDNGYISDRSYDFFAKDGIKPFVVDEFKIIEVTSGRYSNRALVPFFDPTGKILSGFVAIDIIGKAACAENFLQYIRRAKPEDKRTDEEIITGYDYKKVLFCPGAKTGENLFGLDMLLKEGEFKEAFLVEGQRDAIKLQQEGFHALSTHGAHLSTEQLHLLMKHVGRGRGKIYVAYDGDEAGRKASFKVVSKLRTKFSDVVELSMPLGKDPKKFNRAEFLQLIAEQEKGDAFHGRINSVSWEDLCRRAQELHA